MRPKPVKYRGIRSTADAMEAVVEFQQVEGGGWFPLAPRLDIANHSPTGLEWGYRGSGPSQLAIAILATRIEDPDEVLQLAYVFKDQVISALSRDTWVLDGEHVDEMIASLRQLHGFVVGVPWDWQREVH